MSAPKIFTASDNFTRPDDALVYADTDLVANSTTAADVTPLSFKVSGAAGGRVRIRGARLYKSDNDVTAATFRLHLWTVAPTPTNGDNGTLADATGALNYLGYIAIDMSTTGLLTFGDGNVSWGTPVNGVDATFVQLASSDTNLYGLIEAKDAYTPANEEVFTAVLMGENFHAGF